jgi:hypothetical protein
MTRKELETLTAAVGHLREGDHLMCMAHLRRLQLDAEHEFALEDRYHDAWSELETEREAA